MKQCPNCKAELDDNARFCLCCMTSLDEKEQIPPPVYKNRRWSLVLLCFLILGIGMVTVYFCFLRDAREDAGLPQQVQTPEPSSVYTQTVDGVCYTFRTATGEDHPSNVPLGNYFVLIRVEGTPPDGIYRVPSFLNNDTNALVTVVADGAFAGTHARSIDLGYNVRFVWGNAFGGYPLTDLYLHTDVKIEQTAFFGCTEDLTIHGPDYLENTEGVLWSALAADYGFRWKPEAI